MTPEECIVKIREAGRLVIVHKGAVFFNTTDQAEADRWLRLGAKLVPHYDDVEIANRAKKGRRTTQGWEVHVLTACDAEWVENTDGDSVNITNDALLAAARA